MKTKVINRKPKDIDKFISPQKSAEILEKLVDALKTADLGKLVHIAMKIRIV